MNKINLEAVEKIINSELADKIADTKIRHNQIYIVTTKDDIIDVTLFLKSNKINVILNNSLTSQQ